MTYVSYEPQPPPPQPPPPPQLLPPQELPPLQDGLLQVATPTTVVQPLPLVPLLRRSFLFTRDDGGFPPLDATQHPTQIANRTMIASTANTKPKTEPSSAAAGEAAKDAEEASTLAENVRADTRYFM
jgi:hypothetical protein